jgi:hypothetical protein
VPIKENTYNVSKTGSTGTAYSGNEGSIKENAWRFHDSGNK